jgi:hypothetical protein
VPELEPEDPAELEPEDPVSFAVPARTVDLLRFPAFPLSLVTSPYFLPFLPFDVLGLLILRTCLVTMIHSRADRCII